MGLEIMFVTMKMSEEVPLQLRDRLPQRPRRLRFRFHRTARQDQRGRLRHLGLLSSTLPFIECISSSSNR